MKIPDVLLDKNGYPTEEYLEFIKNYNGREMPIMDFLDIIKDGWHYFGFDLGRKYRGTRKLSLHTYGWSGNENIISAILRNIWLTNFEMKYVKWRTGGHYYFEIKI